MPPVDEVEIKETETEVKDEVEKKTDEQLADDMYPDQAAKDKAAKADETEDKPAEGDEKPEDQEKSADKDKEEAGEQEETGTEEEAEALTLTLSKDSPLTEDHLTDFTKFAEEHELPQELAQMMLERDEAAATSFVEKQASDLEASLAKGFEEIENDPVLGGENLEKSQLIANRPIEKYGDKVVDEVLNKRGLINDPSIFRMLHKMGLAMGDDQFIKGDTKVVKKKASLADRMYPKEAKNQEQE